MNIILWELVLVALVAFGLGFWQLYDVNKELKKDKTKAEQSRVDRHNDGKNSSGKTDPQ